MIERIQLTGALIWSHTSVNTHMTDQFIRT